VVEKVEDKRINGHLYGKDSGIAQRRSLSRALYDTN